MNIEQCFMVYGLPVNRFVRREFLGRFTWHGIIKEVNLFAYFSFEVRETSQGTSQGSASIFFLCLLFRKEMKENIRITVLNVPGKI